MKAATHEDQRFLSENDGMYLGALSEGDQDRAWGLKRAGHAQITFNLIGLARLERVPVSYGDGKKAPYGTTYADQVNDDIWSEQ